MIFLVVEVMRMTEMTVAMAIRAESELIRQAVKRCRATGHLTYWVYIGMYIGSRDVVSCRRCGRTWHRCRGKYRNANIANLGYLLSKGVISPWDAFLDPKELPP